MGSITQAPKAPAAASPQVIYYTPSTPSSVPETPADTGGNEGATPQDKSQTRAQNLLRRDRGRLGTILTGFRGILGLSDDAPGRKTLLGE